MSKKKNGAKKKEKETASAAAPNSEAQAMDALPESDLSPSTSGISQSGPHPSLLSGDSVQVVLYTVLLFLAMTVQTRTMSLVLAVLAIAFSVGKQPMANLRARLSLPVLGFALFLILNGAASLYSGFGEYAGGEMAKILASGSLAWILLVRGKKSQARPLLWGFTAVCGIIALLCTEQAYGGPLFQGFSHVMGLLGADYEGLSQAAYSGARFNGIYGDANLTGSLLALGMLVGLHLVRTAKAHKWEKPLACFLLGLSSTGFLIAMSRGAILCFGAALLVYLPLSKRAERLPLFFLMLSSALATAVCAVPAMSLLSSGSGLATVLMLPCGLLIWLLDSLAGQRIAAALEGGAKWIPTVLAALAVVAVGASVAALNLTKPHTFTDSGFLYRAVPVQTGATYTISGDWDRDGEVMVLVYGSNYEQALLNVDEVYYNGPLEDASFTVPEGVTQVFLQFRGADGAQLRSAALSDGTKIRMAYRFLPDSIGNRLQGDFLEDYSFLLRVQYIKDGWTLFTKNPLYGHGLGATEGLLTSVQPFYYESLYLHNHPLQVMDETGLLGLASFLALMGGLAVLLLRKRSEEQGAQAAMLLACLAMMNLHGLMEITFSVRMFQCAAFILTMLAVIVFADPLPLRKTKLPANILMSCLCIWAVVFSALQLGSNVAARRFETLDTDGMTVDEFIETMAWLDRIDVYGDMNYKVNLMINSLRRGDASDFEIATRCAAALRSTGEFDACYQAAAYYYLPLGRLPEFFNSVQAGLAQERANPDAWNSAFNLFKQALQQLDESQMADYVSGICGVGAQMEAANTFLVADVALSEENQALLDAALHIQESDMEADAAYVYLATLLQSAS